MPTRPSRDDILMESAHLWARRSTCSRLHVGAVFARDGRILVTGYNGAPAGIPHCDHTCNCRGQLVKVREVTLPGGQKGVELLDKKGNDGLFHDPLCPSQQPCTVAEHAERNGIAFAARHGVRLEGSELFVTNMPCQACSMALINAGVERIVYDKEYRIHDGVELLRQAGIVVDVHHVE